MKKNSFFEHYLHVLAQQGYSPDYAQEACAKRLQRNEDDWIAFKEKRSNKFKKFFSKAEVPTGVYLWGGVGRGKSVLMDTFYEHLPLKRKIRIHFHEFMQSVHRELEAFKGTSDPLDAVAARVAEKYRLVCFDEFHVSDIADAMILYRLLEALVKNGVGFIMTSNYKPDDLYPDGLHRDRILPAIDLIKRMCDVVNVDTGVDYRKRSLTSAQTYYTPNDETAERALKQLFHSVAGASEGESLHIGHRDIKAIAFAGRVAWFDFNALCATARSQTDYLELLGRFDTFIVSDIPVMSPAMFATARRFTWLIDVMYDHRTKLFISAQAEATKLYTEGQMANEFARTVSRLTEMQSQEYLEEALIPVKHL
ncbi:cell division protein ZapE [Hydromonas duriensis]|uniref:Cell division protein ZapE n=1 Tax=Hydromonas duriensis TaxID=1527608 RepID=A0A4V3DJM7_9BURK|nr:cell division protein ZapE [Hydromonas duriensis]TDR30759.1 cell division protein ZapE [Hydromonas duriensis]